MTLPIISDPSHITILPSTGEEIVFRSYKVREEKILLTASEGGNVKDMLRAVTTIISNCVVGELDVNKLTPTDVDWLWVQLTIKSVSPLQEVIVEVDDEKHKVELNLEDVFVDDNVKEVDSKVELGDGVFIEFAKPSLEQVIEMEERFGDITFAIKTCIASVYNEEKVFDLDEYTPEDMDKFVESFPHHVSKHFREFQDAIPKTKLVIQVGGKEVILEGIRDFFRRG